MVELHAAAEEEIRTAAAWYEDCREGLGERLLAAVDAAGKRIETAPFEGALWTRPDVPGGVRRVRVGTFPYSLVYLTEPGLVVLALAHDRQRPGYWRGRGPWASASGSD